MTVSLQDEVLSRVVDLRREIHRHPELGFEEARTQSLIERELDELGVVSTDCLAQAVGSVHGRWWFDGDPIRRDLDTGLTGLKRPWLVPDLACCPGAQPAPLALPDLSDVRGHDMRDAFELRIHPSRWLLKRMLGPDGWGDYICGEAGVLVLVERVRADVRAHYGPDADRP